MSVYWCFNTDNYGDNYGDYKYIFIVNNSNVFERINGWVRVENVKTKF